MNVNQSVGHLWDGIILISACFYNKSLNSQAANTSPAHMQTINNHSSLTPGNKKSPSAVLYLPSGLSWRLLPTRTWAVPQVQVCWSEPSSNTSSKNPPATARLLRRHHSCPRPAASPPPAPGGRSVPPLQAAWWRRCASCGAELRVALTAAAACESVRNIPPHWCRCCWGEKKKNKKKNKRLLLT